MILPVLGAFVGAVFGGWPGFLIGGFVGYLAGIGLQRAVIGGLRVAQSGLIDATFSVMGAICKADSVVTRDEINTVEQVFKMFNLHGDAKQQAKDAFNRGKQPDFDLDAAVDSFASISRGRGPLLQ
ncbi:MAG: co-chaperone DjlA, partial [Woeseiaceae bacterium]